MSNHRCSDEQHVLCINNNKCHLCHDGQLLFKKSKELIRKEKLQAKRQNRVPKQKKQGMDFEKKVAARINRQVIKPIARRQPGSGAFATRPGDIITPDQLIECKERGSTNSRGESQITIPRSHLEKVKAEAFQAGRDVWYYIYKYKNHDEFYVVKDFNDELAMLEQIKELQKQLDELKRNDVT